MPKPRRRPVLDGVVQPERGHVVGHAGQAVADRLRRQLLDARIVVGIGRLDAEPVRQRGDAFDLEAAGAQVDLDLLVEAIDDLVDDAVLLPDVEDGGTQRGVVAGHIVFHAGFDLLAGRRHGDATIEHRARNWARRRCRS